MTPLSYDRFRLGMTFRQVRDYLAHEQRQARESGLYMFVSRSTVLGRMAQYKREAYTHYLASFAENICQDSTNENFA